MTVKIGYVEKGKVFLKENDSDYAEVESLEQSSFSSPLEIQTVFFLKIHRSKSDEFDNYFVSLRNVVEDVYRFFAQYGFGDFTDLRFSLMEIYDDGTFSMEQEYIQKRIFVYVEFPRENVPSKYAQTENSFEEKDLEVEFGKYLYGLMNDVIINDNFTLIERSTHVYSDGGYDVDEIEIYFNDEKFDSTLAFKKWLKENFPNTICNLKTQKNGDSFFVGFLTSSEALEIVDASRKNKIKPTVYDIKRGHQITYKSLKKLVGNNEFHPQIYGY